MTDLVTCSSAATVILGIPQGSVLGPEFYFSLFKGSFTLPPHQTVKKLFAFLFVCFVYFQCKLLIGLIKAFVLKCVNKTLCVMLDNILVR